MNTKTAKDLQLITDTQGNYVWGDKPEPEPGSVVLTNGVTGTMWQRHFTDGLWYPSRPQASEGRSWVLLTRRRNTVLVYDAPSREE